MNILPKWFEENQRDFPWRQNPSPYAVWVSEVMLQQTQAAVVIPYFLRWMERFPSVEALGQTSEQEVLKLWEGLGYYARARHLHEGAKQVISSFKGEIPSEKAFLKQIKGLGPYTIGAIRSFAFHQKAVAVDGNVARVIARLYALEIDVTSAKGLAFLREKVLELLPDVEPWVTMEALIELGALVCTKTPQCAACPLQAECSAYREGRERELPFRGKKVQYEQLTRFAPIICCQDKWLLRKEEGRRVMRGLWEFPYFEQVAHEEWKKVIEKRLGISCQFVRELSEVRHAFTRFRVRLFPSLWECAGLIEVEGYEWVCQSRAQQLPFSSGHRQIREQLRRSI